MHFISIIISAFALFGLIGANEKLFEQSIFKALINRKGQFTSEIDFHFWTKGFDKSYNVSEKYSFLKNIGESVQADKEGDVYGPAAIDKFLYINSSEFYYYSLSLNMCFSSHEETESSSHFFGLWTPSFIQKAKYKLISPSVLLEVFTKNFDQVKCEDKKAEEKTRKCSISMNETLLLEYSFVDKEEYTMYPEKIEAFVKRKNDWFRTIRLIYQNFIPFFDDEPIVNSNLPIGSGCERLYPKKYPKIKTNYGKIFEIEQNVAFNYKEQRLNPATNYMTFKWINFARNYSNKMYVNLSNSSNIAETTDEFTNKSITTIYDMKTNLLYSIQETNCSIYNLTSNLSINWFYLQDSFVKKPELYRIKQDYSYMGEFVVNNVTYLVFEKVFVNRDNRFYQSTDVITNRPKKNGMKFEILISTHYYPKDLIWNGNLNGYMVPKFIEIRMLWGFSFIANLSINFDSFQSVSTNNNNYNLAKCSKSD